MSEDLSHITLRLKTLSPGTCAGHFQQSQELKRGNYHLGNQSGVLAYQVKAFGYMQPIRPNTSSLLT